MKKIKTTLIIIFTCITFTSISQNFTGTWKSSYGELRLVQEGNEVYGDYKDIGSIYGTRSGNTVTGKFTNKDKVGNFIWKITSRNKFEGKWAWGEQNPSGDWNATKSNASTPNLTSNYALLMPKKVQSGNWSNISHWKNNDYAIEMKVATPIKWVDYVYAISNTDKEEGTVTISKEQHGIEGTNKEITKGTPEDKGDQICVTDIIRFDINAQDLGSFALNGVAPHIFPGNILELSKIKDGNYNSQVLQPSDRLPLELVVDGTNNYANIETPTNGLLRSKVNDMIFNSTESGGGTSVLMKSIETTEDLAFSLTGNYSSKSQGIAANMGVSKTKKHGSYYFMIDVTQFDFQINASIINGGYVKEHIDASKYGIIHSVNYGKRAVIMVKTSFTDDQLKANLGVKYSQLGDAANINAAMSFLQKDKNLEVRAFYYGGNSSNHINTLVKELQNGKSDFIKLLNGLKTDLPNSSRYALPISYNIAALDGNPLYFKSSFTTEKTTCTPKPKDVKFAIRFSQLKVSNGRDGGDNPDDLVLSEKIYLKVNGQKIKPYKELQLHPSSNSQIGDPVIFSNWGNQLHIKNKERYSINNSFVYEIPGSSIDVPDMQMSIHHWLKEFTKGDDWLIATWDRNFHQIPIRDIINALITNADKKDISKNGYLTFSEDTEAIKPIYNGSFVLSKRGAKYHYFYTIELFE